MKMWVNGILALVMLMATAALAAEPATPAKGANRTEVSKAAPAKSEGRTASGPVKLAGGSQQNRMRECNKSATGKKGAERKAFMKSCLSTRKG